MKTNGEQYEVLSPWAEADPIPLRGINPRVAELSGKKIGLFCNSKRAAVPIMNAVEKGLKQRFPEARFDRYRVSKVNTLETETENRAKFEAWVEGVDAVVTAVGD